MRGHELIDRVKGLAKKRGVEFKFDPTRGKGSHGTLWFGSRFTVLPNPRNELKKATLAGICRQLGIRPQDIQGR